MIRDGVGFDRVVVVCGCVDLRRGGPGLAAYVTLNYGVNPFANKGTLYLFHGSTARNVKGICFEGIGLATYTVIRDFIPHQKKDYPSHYQKSGFSGFL